MQVERNVASSSLLIDAMRSHRVTDAISAYWYHVIIESCDTSCSRQVLPIFDM